jgi:hypothetical protein
MTRLGFAVRVFVLWCIVLVVALLLVVNLPGILENIPTEDVAHNGVFLLAFVIVAAAVCGAVLLTWRWSTELDSGKPKR